MSFLPEEFYHSGPGKGFPVKVPGGFALFISTKTIRESRDYGDYRVIQYDILYETLDGELFFLRGDIPEPDCFGPGDDCFPGVKYLNLMKWDTGVPNAELLGSALSDPIFEKITNIEEFNGYSIIFPESKETAEYAEQESIPKDQTEMSSDDYKQLQKQGLLYW